MKGYKTDCRFFADSDETLKLHWYRVPKDRPCLPFASFVEDSDWNNNNGPRATIFKGISPDEQGEQWTDRPADRQAPSPDSTFTGHFCGTAEQWSGDLEALRPEDIGSLLCCNDNKLGAFDCSWGDAFDNWGPCP
jgi:hypothetical protein